MERILSYPGPRSAWSSLFALEGSDGFEKLWCPKVQLFGIFRGYSFTKVWRILKPVKRIFVGENPSYPAECHSCVNFFFSHFMNTTMVSIFIYQISVSNTKNFKIKSMNTRSQKLKNMLGHYWNAALVIIWTKKQLLQKPWFRNWNIVFINLIYIIVSSFSPRIRKHVLNR